MITIIGAQKRDYSDDGWRRVRRLFPANSIHEIGNTHFGKILIVNDYTIFPGFGFDMHPHQNLEQIFLIMDGELTHCDSLNNMITLKKNFVQHITAGSGYARSFYNYGVSPAWYISVWFLPKTQNALPTHETREYNPLAWHNKFFPIVSNMPIDAQDVILFNADATLYRSTIENSQLSLFVTSGQKALLYIIDGEASCNDEKMTAGSHVRIIGEENIILHSDKKAECIFVLMKT